MRILPPRLFLLTIAVMALAHLLLPSPFQLPPWWRGLGLLLVPAGLAITISAARRFARLATNIKTFDEPTLLVTDGLFRWSRNPMYLGFSTALLGVALLLGTLAPLLAAAAYAAVADRWYIRFEERAMRATFGGAYDDYARTTRRWL